MIVDIRHLPSVARLLVFSQLVNNLSIDYLDGSSKMKTKTYWNGERCRASKVIVTVANKGRFKYPWFEHLVGCVVDAVEVVYGGSCFYLYDSDGSGWRKVTVGRGSPNYPHRELEIDESTGIMERA